MSIVPPWTIFDYAQFTGGNYTQTSFSTGTGNSNQNVYEDYKPYLLACMQNSTCSGIMSYYNPTGLNDNYLMTYFNASGTSGSGNEYIMKPPNIPQLCNTANIDTMYDPMFSQFCLSYCTQANNEGMCDQFMIPYCATAKGQADNKCSCINSKINSTGYNPLCVDQICQIFGYRTGALQSSSTQPCNIVDCTTAIQLAAGGNISLNKNNIQQNCGSSQSSTTQTVTATPNMANPTTASGQSIPVNTQTSTQSSTPPVYDSSGNVVAQSTSIFTLPNIIIGILIICVIIGGIFFLMK
jgi:hypothetical protein